MLEDTWGAGQVWTGEEKPRAQRNSIRGPSSLQPVDKHATTSRHFLLYMCYNVAFRKHVCLSIATG
jgi:hypothetical protein